MWILLYVWYENLKIWNENTYLFLLYLMSPNFLFTIFLYLVYTRACFSIFVGEKMEWEWVEKCGRVLSQAMEYWQWYLNCMEEPYALANTEPLSIITTPHTMSSISHHTLVSVMVPNSPHITRAKVHSLAKWIVALSGNLTQTSCIEGKGNNHLTTIPFMLGRSGKVKNISGLCLHTKYENLSV